MNWLLRLRAAGIHLISSLVVAAIAASVVFLVWYPWPYRIVAGGQDLFVLLMTVDIIMGPLLTFAIFNLKKPMKELKRDLAIIVTLQLLALGYGLHTVYLARPAVTALEVDRFRVVSANDVVQDELDKAPPALKELSLTGPRLVGTRDAKEEEKLDAIMLGASGYDLGTRPSFWREWDDFSRQRTLKRGKSLSEWLTAAKSGQAPRDIGDPAAVEEAVARSGRSADQLLYLPLLSRRTDWSVLVDKSTGDPVGFAPIDVK